MNQTIAILDFGSQYAQLIARRVRENRVFSLLVPPTVTPKQLKDMNAVGLIFSGGPASVYEKESPQCDPALLEMGLPVLGICYGMQVTCRLLGARVDAAKAREYGRTRLDILAADGLLSRIPSPTNVWMSHGDMVQSLPADFVPLAATPNCPVAAVRHRTRPVFGVQFHPEVTHTAFGGQLLRNFLYDICGSKGDWEVGSFVTRTIESIRARVGADERVICGLSGGVDSSVTAALLREAIGERLVCIFVDNGLLRKNEVSLVESTFRDHFKINLQTAPAGPG